MKLIIIAALNRKRVIGRGGKIPWHIPEDLKRFKELTMGHALLMGRKTYESIGKKLPGRRNVVITSQSLPNIEHYHSIDEALGAVKEEEKVFVIGGGEIFRQTMHRVDELFLTVVNNEESGDAFFPEFETEFQIQEIEKHQGFVYKRFERK